ncbi:hypothetical protein [Ectobacillus funiculus]|nr:hypothetical protein [Ectobacillus funiculus]
MFKIVAAFATLYSLLNIMVQAVGKEWRCMRFAAAVFGMSGMMSIHVFWLLVSEISTSSFAPFVSWLYIAQLFVFGILGAYRFRTKVWYMHMGILLILCIWAQSLLYAGVLADSLLRTCCVLFGSVVYKMLFREKCV